MIISGIIRFFDIFKRSEELSGDPIIILGHPRSGTTFLHRFMTDSLNLGTPVRLKDMVLPSKTLRGPLDRFLKKRESKGTGSFYDPKIHKTGLFEAETDDVALFFRYFEGMFSWIYFHSWEALSRDVNVGDILIKHCRSIKYARYLKRLYRLVAKEGKPVISKSFSLIFNIENFLKIFPDAKILVLMRDPKESVPSSMSLINNIQESLPLFKSVSGERRNQFYNALYRSSMEFYKETDSILSSGNNKNIFVVNYLNLKNDFVAEMNRVISFCGLEISENTSVKIDSQALKQKEYIGLHKYSLDEYGLSEEILEKDLDFIYQKYL